MLKHCKFNEWANKTELMYILQHGQNISASQAETHSPKKHTQFLNEAMNKFGDFCHSKIMMALSLKKPQ